MVSRGWRGGWGLYDGVLVGCERRRECCLSPCCLAVRSASVRPDGRARCVVSWRPGLPAGVAILRQFCSLLGRGGLEGVGAWTWLALWVVGCCGVVAGGLGELGVWFVGFDGASEVVGRAFVVVGGLGDCSPVCLGGAGGGGGRSFGFGGVCFWWWGRCGRWLGIVLVELGCWVVGWCGCCGGGCDCSWVLVFDWGCSDLVYPGG